MKFLSSISYPESARANNIQGAVYSKFIIDKYGKTRDVSIQKSSGSPILDEAVIAHISRLPDWEPGLVSGKPVNVSFVVPVKFSLTGGLFQRKSKK